MKHFAPIALAVIFISGCASLRPLPGPCPVSDLERARAAARLEKGIEQLVRKGDVKQATSDFAQAVELDPVSVRNRLWAALIAELQADNENAFEHLLWAINFGDRDIELAIWSAYRLYSTTEQARRLVALLSRVVSDSRKGPGIRARARQFLGHSLRYLGEFSEAEAVFSDLGYIGDWMVVGPFNNDQNAGFDTVYPPEEGFDDYEGSYQGKRTKVSFRRVRHFDYDGRVNLAALLDPSRWTCAYLVSYLHVDRDTEAAFRLGAYRGVKLWLNGRLLLSDDKAHIGAMDQYVVGGRLEKGWNKLLVKVCQRTGPWQLRLRVTNSEGRGLEGLKTSVEIHSSPDRSEETRPLPEAKYFSGYLKGLEDDPDGFYRFLEARWSRRLGFYRRAVGQATALADAFPKCPLYRMELVRAHFAAGHEGSALKALAAVERSCPGLPDATLERIQYEQRNSRFERAMRMLSRLDEDVRELPSVRMTKISLLSDRGFDVDALREARALLDLQPDRSSLWRTIGILHTGLGQRDLARMAYRRALRLRANHAATYDRLISMALRRGQSGQAIRLVRKKKEAFPCLISSALKEAKILLAEGFFDKALAVCDRIGKIAPDYWYLHRLRGDILYRRGDRESALEQYHDSIRLHPDNASLREYLDFLEQKEDEAFQKYALNPAEIEEVIATHPDPRQYPEAETVFLLDDHVSHLFNDGSSKHQVHQIYLICTEKGQRAFNHFRIPATSTFRLEIAETVQPDGTRQEATDIRRGVIHFPSLEPGSILHVAYSYESSSLSWMQDHFAMHFNFQDYRPSLRARWVLVMPEEKELEVLKLGEGIRHRTEKLGEEKVFIWTAEDMPMLHRENLRPPVRNIRAAVYVSTVPSWDELARWQNSLISDQFEIDEDIRKKTRQLTAGATSKMEKLEAVYRFVAKEIRYLNHDAGIFGKKPNKAVNIFENKFGDCKDKATLMIAMLKAIGIDAAYAGIRTFDRGPVFWEVPHAQTNHIITYVPVQEGISSALFIDGTSQFGNLLHLPERNQGVRALVLDGQEHEFVETPLLDPEASRLVLDMRARIAGNELEIEGRETWSGWFASFFRSRLNVEGKRHEELTKEMNYRYPGARLSEDSYTNLDNLGPTAATEFKLKVPGRVRKEGKTLRVKPLWYSNMVRRMARKPERHYDIFMVYRTSFALSSKLAVPSGHEIASLPAGVKIDNDLIYYSRYCSLDASSVTCKRVLTLKKRKISRARYQEFREICSKIDQAEEQDIVLQPLDL